MQKKISVIFTPDDQEQMKEMSPEFSLKAGTETKSIAGYNGKKYEVSEKKSGQNFEAWFTTEVDIPQNTATLFYDKSYGFPLQFSTIINRVPVKALVKEIKATTVPAGIFTATKDYEEMTFQELMNMMPGRK